MKREKIGSPISPIKAALPKTFMEGYVRAISTVIPRSIMAEAEDIVLAHRQEGTISGSEVLNMALSSQDHGFLNGLIFRVPAEESRRIFAQKRAQYAGDRVAQQQIDAYDSSSIYHTKFDQLSDARRSRDKHRQQQLASWFKKHYPNL